MKKFVFLILLACMASLVFSQTKTVRPKGVSVIPDEASRKVDIYIDGKLFTSYIYPTTLEKPTLFPVRTPAGTVITRGFPLEPRAGERVDHPHHVGWWFNYGDVNGLDFWNNSYVIPAANKPKYGSIVHAAVVKAESGDKQGVLEVNCNWVDINKNVLLTENTRFIFSGNSQVNKVVRITKLTAPNGEVVFGDNKEGMCAIRVDRAFEAPSNKPEVFTDANGNPTTVAALNNEGVNGVYRSSKGIEKDAVWGTTGTWMKLSAKKGNEDISICMFDHPKNFGYPAHWHARGYGLFAVNNIGSKVYNPNDPEGKLILKKGESITFKHELLIKTGGFMTDDAMNAEEKIFAKE